jgi:hypothetical protein
MNTPAGTYRFSPVQKDPVLDLTPHHARMATCYKDDAGGYHLFVDFIHADLNTVQSWQAEIRYYRSSDLRSWEYVRTELSRNDREDDPEQRAPDCYGVGSPHILWSGSRLLLFYTGRGGLPPDQSVDSHAEPGRPGYVSGDIMLAQTTVDAGGAPAGPFTKTGVVLPRDRDWKRMRVDDPCAVVYGGDVHLFYKGFRSRTDLDGIAVGHAAARNRTNLSFEDDPEPILRVHGGAEMPRVFRDRHQWQLFLRHFDRSEGSVWRHYSADQPDRWVLVNPRLFDCAGLVPGTGAADMMLISGRDGRFMGKALACGLDQGVLKLWLYDVESR